MQAEQSRSLSEFGLDDEQLWGLVDAAPDAMVMVDEAGRILLVNRQTEELFGYERRELLGRPVEDLLPEELRRRQQAPGRDLLARLAHAPGGGRECAAEWGGRGGGGRPPMWMSGRRGNNSRGSAGGRRSGATYSPWGWGA